MTAPDRPGGEDRALADDVAAAVLGVPGVAGLHAGLFGEVATYLPGRRVRGVRVGPEDDAVAVHVVVEWDAPVPATVDAIRTAVAGLVAGTVHVTVEDVAAPGEAATTRRNS
ncbi:Asp23/Gls24 family envelope stress response protein [Jiangella alkaliphila]|uniref:Uncharacterized conserved protein YloU, alkaline shock protein (Asp23) family n=1 Tax=Jiangella alkaliphila TaxID=419479 RepID=A0A1H2L716_9ACTN|nr:Asp23/Gls24 family envelope stress response protein [Jiangella alkaliphila]SDU76857.1 Uncharacterized conserved protein YloU, alkaline shock protein (Asp23) family [Jiangella alkaliphila]